MEYWRSAVVNVTTWAFKFKFLDTRNLNQGALENTFDAIRLHCGSNNNPSDALKTVIINGLAYRSLYGTNRGWCLSSGQATLLSEPSNASSTSVLTSQQCDH
jgi:hypothetical protein